MLPTFQAMARATALFAAALSAAGCISTPEEIRHEEAIERLNGGLTQQLDRLLLRWSGAATEANRTSEEVYRLRIERLVRDPDNLFAVKTGLFSSDEAVVATCAAALGFSSAMDAPERLLPLLSHENAGVRSNAALGLYLLGGRGCPIPKAMALLAEGDPGVRAQGAMLVARVLQRGPSQKDTAKGPPKADGESAHYDGLLAYYEVLSDVDEGVRVNVAQGIGIVGNPAGAMVLVERALNDRSPRVRYAAAQSLAKLRPAAFAEQILAALKREFNRYVKRELVGALRAITDLDITAVAEWEKELPEWRWHREHPGETKEPAKRELLPRDRRTTPPPATPPAKTVPPVVVPPKKNDK